MWSLRRHYAAAEHALAADGFLTSRSPRLWSVVDTLVLNRASAIARYGSPIGVVADTVRSQINPEVLDRTVTMRFRSFEAHYHVHHSGRTELWHVTIAVPGSAVPPEVSPGASRQSLLGCLGPPDTESTEADGQLLFYSLCGAED